MKAQFAFIEALAVFITLLVALSALASVANAYAESAQNAEKGIKASEAEYDLMNMVLHNTTARECLAHTAYTACMKNYSALFRRIYGLDAFNISQEAQPLGTYARCFAYNASTESEICIYAG